MWRELPDLTDGFALRSVVVRQPPQPGGPIRTRGRGVPAVGRYREPTDFALVAEKTVLFRGRLQVPKTHAPVLVR